MNETFYIRTGKRCVDAACSLAGIILLSPVVLLLAVAIKFTSRGPVFFRQIRVGKNGKPFRIWKFRTMVESAERTGPAITAGDDSRITPLGRRLRRTKLDELPQLFNVLAGDMSFVGPRPEVPAYGSAYAGRYQRILLAKPGITGPAQNMYAHEERLLAGRADSADFYAATILPRKLTLDLQYCGDVRFASDLKWIGLTIANLFAQSTALRQPPQAPPTGPAKATRFRETRMEEILGRESIEVPNFENISAPSYQGKRVLITGAGGSIGSELARQLLRLQPERIAILDKDENSIYELEQELRQRKPAAFVEPVVADVRDFARVRAIFCDFRPEIVFHAAAHKHVPLMELQPCEAVINNIGGTRNVLDAVAEFGVERFVFISSDKAVNPANVMGATKRIGELLVQASAKTNATRAACVRFGNVIGSRGSVVPLFQQQITNGGPVTVTHSDIVRYFMTVQEAVQLILCAGTLADAGEIFVLEMGSPRNILELAREMIRLSGLEPDKDIEIQITGLRPGEKLQEELISSEEQRQPTRFEQISVIVPEAGDLRERMADIARLMRLAHEHDSAEVSKCLAEMQLGVQSPELSQQALVSEDR